VLLSKQKKQLHANMKRICARYEPKIESKATQTLASSKATPSGKWGCSLCKPCRSIKIASNLCGARKTLCVIKNSERFSHFALSRGATPFGSDEHQAFYYITELLGEKIAG
jgi:hypothetical protein